MQKESINLHGNTDFHLGEERFKEIRKIARFERIRNWLYVKKYARFIYEIEILQQYYGNSKYLTISNAQACYGLQIAAEQKKLTDCYTKPQKTEGKIRVLNQVFENLTPTEVIVLGLRNITDALEKYPNNKYLINLHQKALVKLINNDFNLTDYSSRTFQEEASLLEEIKNDSTNVYNEQIIDLNSEAYKKLSKYEKIKIKERINNASNKSSQLFKTNQKIDTAKYHFYALSDLVKSGALERCYKQSKENKQENPNTDVKKEKREKVADVNSVAIVEPFIYADKSRLFGHSEKQIDEILEMESKFAAALNRYQKSMPTEIKQFTKAGGGTINAEAFNYKSALLRMLYQQFGEEKKEILVTDYELFYKLSSVHNTDYIIFPYLKYNKNRSAFLGIPFLCAYPIAPLIIKVMIDVYQTTTIGYVVYDTKSNRFLIEDTIDYNGKLRKMKIQAKLYELIKTLEYNAF